MTEQSSTDKKTSPLYPLLNEIEVAAENNLCLVAITATVALPHICAALMNEDARANGEDYKRWCRENLEGPKFSMITAEDLYSLRCGILHQGRVGGLVKNIERVVFAPKDIGAIFTNCQLNGSYVYSVNTFCRSFIDAVYHWFEAHRDEPTLQKNLPHLMQYRIGGFPPDIIGPTVIA